MFLGNSVTHIFCGNQMISKVQKKQAEETKNNVKKNHDWVLSVYVHNFVVIVNIFKWTRFVLFFICIASHPPCNTSKWLKAFISLGQVFFFFKYSFYILYVCVVVAYIQTKSTPTFPAVNARTTVFFLYRSIV